MPHETAIIFGGSGYLGSHVVDSLTERGYKVKIFDRATFPYPLKDQEMILGDIMDIEKVQSSIKGCDYVYNFAGVADIDEAKDQPIEATKINVLGNVILLEASCKHNVKRFVYASSIYVYGHSGSFYGVSKQSSERFIEAFHERYGIPYTILRYGSLYGRRANEKNGVYRLIREALTKKTITYQGTGEAIREYIHVKDAADASVYILARDFINQHMSLTGNEKMKVKDFMAMLAEMLPGEIELVFQGNKIEGHYEITPYSFNPKLGKKLVKTCHIDLGQGILDTMAEIYESLESRDKRHCVR